MSVAVVPSTPASNFCLLGYFKGVIDFDTQIPHGGLQLGVSKQQLHSSKVLGAPIDQRHLGSSHGVGPIVGSVESQFVNPVPQNSCVLPRAQMGRFMKPAGKQEVI